MKQLTAKDSFAGSAAIVTVVVAAAEGAGAAVDDEVGIVVTASSFEFGWTVQFNVGFVSVCHC